MYNLELRFDKTAEDIEVVWVEILCNEELTSFYKQNKCSC